jgi:nucleoside-diphosphate-sugar epimerase
MGKSILVTGCAGFIGSHLVEELLARGEVVFGIDNFDPFYDRSTKERNLAHAMAHPRFGFQEADICDRDALQSLPFKPDAVIHLAAKAGVRPSMENPSAYVQTNIQGTLNLLDWMKGVGVWKMIFASSSSVYGNHQRTPFREDDSPDFPVLLYAFTKRARELKNHAYHHLHGLSIINLRFFAVYGERQRPDLAIHRFNDRILEGKPIRMYGDGSSLRDYTYVADAVDGAYRAPDSPGHHPRPMFETYNLGNCQPISLKKLIGEIEKAVGTKAVIQQMAPQAGDVECTHADIGKAKSLLGYAPQTGIEAGIARFLAWKKQTSQP